MQLTSTSQGACLKRNQKLFGGKNVNEKTHGLLLSLLLSLCASVGYGAEQLEAAP